MRHVSKELQIHRVSNKSVAALSIHLVTHESAAIDAKVDFVAVAVLLLWFDLFGLRLSRRSFLDVIADP